MGIMKEPAHLQEEDPELSSSIEDELLSEHGQDGMPTEQYLELLQQRDQDGLGPIPMDEYLKLQFRMFTKRLPRNLGQVVLVATGFAALMACAMLAATALRQSLKPPILRTTPSEPLSPVHHTESLLPQSPTAMPTDSHEQFSCDYKTMVFCSARSLFHSPEIHRVVTDNLMRTNNRFLTQGDYEMVKEFAWMGFKKINAELQARAPMVASELERVQLKVGQKDAVLDLLMLLSDPEVQALGYDVAEIIRKSKFATRKFLKAYIEDSLKPINEIQKLAHLVLPRSVLALWGKRRHDWEMTLDPRNIHSMRKEHMNRNANITGVDFETKSLSIYAGVLEEGRVLLDIMKLHMHSTGSSWSTALRDTIELLFEGISLPAERSKLAFMDAFLWPLKCGTQGLDALRASVSQEYAHEFKR